MLKCLKRLFTRNERLSSPSQTTVTAPSALAALEEYLSPLPDCDAEPSTDFYYRTEAAGHWSRYFGHEFSVTCRNPGRRPSHDLTMNTALSNLAQVQGLVYVFYYYDSFTCTQSLITRYLKCIVTASGELQPSSFDMRLCFPARYRRNTPILAGRQSDKDGSQNNSECRYIICDNNSLAIPRQDIQIHLNGHWYQLPPISDPILGRIMVKWADDSLINSSSAKSLLKVLAV